MYFVHNGSTAVGMDAKQRPKIAAMNNSRMPSREKNPAGRRRSVLRHVVHVGTARRKIVSVRPMLKKRVTRVSWSSILQSVEPQLQQKVFGNPSWGLSTCIDRPLGCFHFIVGITNSADPFPSGQRLVTVFRRV